MSEPAAGLSGPTRLSEMSASWSGSLTEEWPSGTMASEAKKFPPGVLLPVSGLATVDLVSAPRVGSSFAYVCSNLFEITFG